MTQKLNGFTHWLTYGIRGDVTCLPEPGLDRQALLDRIEDHVIEQARVIGIYEH